MQCLARYPPCRSASKPYTTISRVTLSNTPPQLKQSLVALLKNCDTVAKDMVKVLESTLKSKLGASVSWSTSGSSEMDKLRVRLEAHKASIEIALEMVSMYVAIYAFL